MRSTYFHRLDFIILKMKALLIFTKINEQKNLKLRKYMHSLLPSRNLMMNLFKKVLLPRPKKLMIYSTVNEWFTNTFPWTLMEYMCCFTIVVLVCVNVDDYLEAYKFLFKLVLMKFGVMNFDGILFSWLRIEFFFFSSFFETNESIF